MALMKCPKCNKEISDKAKYCPNCGCEVSNMQGDIQLFCKECGNRLTSEDTVCPKCGCLIEARSKIYKEPQKVEVTRINVNKHKIKNIGIICSSLVAIIILVVISYIVINTNNEKKQFNIYIDKVNEITDDMQTGASSSEDLCNLTSSVWYNSIYKKSSSSTNKYCINSKYYKSSKSEYSKSEFYDDFNLALTSMVVDKESDIKDIEQNQSDVDEKMKELQMPPKGAENCYSALSDLYGKYQTLTNLAVDPSGNLTTYQSNVTTAEEGYDTGYRQMNVQIPQKK